MNPDGVPVIVESTRVEHGRMIATVRMPDGSTDEFSGPAPAGWSVGFLAGRDLDSEREFEFRDLASKARSVADDMASRPAKMRIRLFEQPFEWGSIMDVLPAGEPYAIVLSHLHDWRDLCNACPVCQVHDGFHEDERHAARDVPAACLMPVGDERRPARGVRTPEEIEAVRAERRARREGQQS